MSCLNNPPSNLDYEHPPLTYRLAHGMVIHQLIPRCTAAGAALVGRVIPAEMFTSSIINRTVGVFGLCRKNEQQERHEKLESRRVTGR